MPPLFWIPSSSSAAIEAMDLYSGFSKVQGILLVRALGLSTLDGLIVDPQTASAPDVMSEVAKLHPSQVLIRHDKRPETGHYPQGGYICQIEALHSELAWHKNEQRLLIALSPADPLRNGYSAGVVVTFDNIAQIDIVGPGFDAGDLNRGFVSPHESHQFALGPPHRKLASFQIDPALYMESVELRIRKIALKYIRHERYIFVDTIELDAAQTLLRNAYSKLPNIQSLLARRPYVPAPTKFIQHVLSAAQTIANMPARYRDGDKMVAFSQSQIDAGAATPVWDIVVPRRKYSFT